MGDWHAIMTAYILLIRSTNALITIIVLPPSTVAPEVSHQYKGVRQHRVNLQIKTCATTVRMYMKFTFKIRYFNERISGILCMVILK